MNKTKRTEEHANGSLHLQKEGKSCVIGFGIPNHLREVWKQQVSNCNFTSFTVPHHLLQQLLLCVIDAYCLRLLTLKKFYFQFYRQNWSRTEWIALQKNQSSGDFGPASKQTNIFFGGRIYLGTTPVMHRTTRITPPPKNIYDTFGNISFLDFLIRIEILDPILLNWPSFNPTFLWLCTHVIK